MNVIINGSATPGDEGGETTINMEFGEIEQETFSLVQLAELTGTEDCEHKVYVFDMNTDQQFAYKATGIAVVQYHVDEDLERLFLVDHVIDGPFLLMLAVGENLKAFHCEDCAQDFVDWFLTRQPIWRNKYHGDLSLSTPTPKKSYQ